MAMTDVRFQASEYVVGANHATLTDTINRLVKGVNNFRLILSGGNLTLAPVNGNLVDINGVIYQCTAMPTLAPAGLTPGQTYYIYLYNNAGTETLEASATGYTVDATGRAYKTGDATRRLMGMAYAVAGPAFIDTLATRGVISYDNQRQLRLFQNFTADRLLINQPNLTEVNSEIRLTFPLFAKNGLIAQVNGMGWNGTTGVPFNTGIGVDGAAPTLGAANAISQPVGSYNQNCQVAKIVGPGDLSEAVHYLTIMGNGSAVSTATWHGGADNLAVCLSALVWG